jgi:predicted SprT family Zn-dependent metalloprotease
MGMSHANCSHPRTPAGRAACRKAGGPTESAVTAPSVLLAPKNTTEELRGLGDVRRMAEQLMMEHGVSGWSFSYDNAKRRFGACHYRKQAITLSRDLTEANINKPDVIRDVILHEIAHALTPGAHHGPRWQAMAARIGARPERCYSSDDVTPVAAPYVGTCPACGNRITAHRAPRRITACRKGCRQHNGGRYTDRFRFVWHRTGN